MKPQVSLPHSQEPATDACPKPDKSSLYNHFNTGANLHLLLIRSRGLFPWGLPTKIWHAYIMLAMRATYPFHLILKGKLLIRYLPKLKWPWTLPWLFTSQGMKLTTHFHPVWTPRVDGAIPPIPYIPTWCARGQLHLHLLPLSITLTDFQNNVAHLSTYLSKITLRL